MPKYAANLTMMFNEVPFQERFAAAAKAGFEAVEFLFPYEYAPEDIAGWLQQSRLRNVLFNMPPGDWAGGERGTASIPGREAEFRASVELALTYARVLGTPCLHVMAGRLPPGADRDEHLAVYVKNLRLAAGMLARENRTALIEPINARDMPRYLIHTQEEAHAVRERVGADNLKVQMDFYHVQIAQGDVATRLRAYIGTWATSRSRACRTGTSRTRAN